MKFMNFRKKVDQSHEEAPLKDLSEADLSPEIRRQLLEFNQTLANISSMPELFAKIIPNFSHLSSDLKEARERCAHFEQLSKEEQNRNVVAVSEINTLKDEMERLKYSLERERAARSSESQKNIEQNSLLSDLRLANADLNSRLARVEPLVRELKVTKDVLLSQLEKHEEDKELARKALSDYNVEIVRLREQNSNMLEANNNLNSAKQNLADRLDQVTKDLFSRDSLVSSLREQVATLTTKIKREGVVTSALRAENEQLIKDRDDTRSQNENQLEAARGRYRVTERLLEEARTRYRAEAQLLTALRREKNQRDNDVMQMNASISAMKEEIAGYRLQLLSSAEMASELNRKISDEAERRRKLEALNEVANEENGRLDTRLKSISLKMENDVLHYETTISELRGSIEAVRDENERLRSELSSYRFNDPDSEAEPQNADNHKGNVVVKLA
jgi:chromosome segregation ATPase